MIFPVMCINFQWLQVSLCSLCLLFEKPHATNISLYPMMFPYTTCWILQIHMEDTTEFSSGLDTASQTSVFLNWYSPSLSSWLLGRLCINDVAQKCHITALCLRPLSFFESIVIFFFILDYFSNFRHLFFGTSLILLCLQAIVRDLSYKSDALVVCLETFHKAYS